MTIRKTHLTINYRNTLGIYKLAKSFVPELNETQTINEFRKRLRKMMIYQKYILLRE